MERLALETKNITDENIKKILELFPNVATEALDENGKLKTAIDFEKLKQELSEVAIDGEECYDFTWVGKKEAMVEANRPIRKTLRPDRESSVDWENTQNIYIEGDNLDALKLLQESYLGKIKMIYIDPPYNTGKDFVYRDNFTQDKESYYEELGLKDEDENRLFQNTESNGRFHSDWCSMIYSRLKLARNLLSDDGAIFISIDDNEVRNLKNICDEVFGCENFVAQFPWRKRTAKSDVPFGVSQDYEWIICYTKTTQFKASIEGKPRKYYETPDFPNRPWRIHDMTKQTTATERPNSYFTMINPKNGKKYPADPNRTWRITKDTFQKYYDANEIVFPGDYNFLNISKPVARYFKDKDIEKAGENFGRVALSTKLPDDIGMSQDGTKEIKSIFENIIFSFPKTTNFIKYFLKATTKDNDIILDFFSGCATTAHACMQLNAEDGGNRKFIMVQLPEKTDEKSEAFKAGYKNICEIGEERIRRAGKKIQEENPDKKIDIGFRVFKIDDTNMKDVYYTPSELKQGQLNYLETNIKDDRTDEDLLYGCLLDWGVELSLPHKVEIIDGKRVHIVDEDTLIACFEEDIPESVIRKIADMKPLRVVFRDSSFISDDNKINIEEIFKLITPDTRVKVI